MFQTPNKANRENVISKPLDEIHKDNDLNRTLQILIGIQKFEIEPKLNMELVKNRLSKNIKELKIFSMNYRVFVGHISNDSFDINYKIGNNLGSTISGQLNSNTVTIICRPMLQMILLPIFLIGLFLAGLLISLLRFDQSTLGTTFLLISIGIYALSIFLVNLMHKNCANRLLTLIGGGTLKTIN